MQKLIDAAVKDGALTITDTEWVLTNWDAYQPKDITNADRQAKYQKGKRAAKTDDLGSNEGETITGYVTPVTDDNDVIDPLSDRYVVIPCRATIQDSTEQDKTRQDTHVVTSTDRGTEGREPEKLNGVPAVAGGLDLPSAKARKMPGDGDFESKRKAILRQAKADLVGDKN